MPRADPVKEFGAADFEQLLVTIRAAVGEALAVPQLLDGTQARRYVGLSRSGWFRALSAGLVPKPVYVEGSGDRFRRADLDKFIEKLKPRRTRRKADAGEEPDGPEGA